jgi:uncharacterized protein
VGSPLLVDVVELQRRTGTRRTLNAEVELDDMAVGERSVVDGRVTVDLVLEAVTEGIVAAGSLAGVSRVPCRRCLEDVDSAFRLDVREIFERSPSEGETWPIDDERVDLRPVIRELALLALPLAPLCRSDCEGPDAERFPARPEPEDAVEAEPVRDARWAVLDSLTFDE